MSFELRADDIDYLRGLPAASTGAAIAGIIRARSATIRRPT